MTEQTSTGRLSSGGLQPGIFRSSTGRISSGGLQPGIFRSTPQPPASGAGLRPAATTDVGRYRVNPEAAASIHDDGLVILHVPSGRIFTSNRTGARVWQGLQRQLPLDAIAVEISDDYGIDPATARKDAVCFLAELERNGLTERGADQ